MNRRTGERVLSRVPPARLDTWRRDYAQAGIDENASDRTEAHRLSKTIARTHFTRSSRPGPDDPGRSGRAPPERADHRSAGSPPPPRNGHGDSGARSATAAPRALEIATPGPPRRRSWGSWVIMALCSSSRYMPSAASEVTTEGTPRAMLWFTLPFTPATKRSGAARTRARSKIGRTSGTYPGRECGGSRAC